MSGFDELSLNGSGHKGLVDSCMYVGQKEYGRILVVTFVLVNKIGGRDYFLYVFTMVRFL